MHDPPGQASWQLPLSTSAPARRPRVHTYARRSRCRGGRWARRCTAGCGSCAGGAGGNSSGRVETLYSQGSRPNTPQRPAATAQPARGEAGGSVQHRAPCHLTELGAASTRRRCAHRGTSRRGCSCRSAGRSRVGRMCPVGGCRGGRRSSRAARAASLLKPGTGSGIGVRAGARCTRAAAAQTRPRRRGPSVHAASTHLLHVGAGDARVIVQARVASNRLLARMRKWADGPVVHKALCAGDDLQGVWGR